MRNYFPKRPSGAPLHTLSKLYDVPVGYVPPPYFEAEYCLFCGRRRVAVARYRMICLVLFSEGHLKITCFNLALIVMEEVVILLYLYLSPRLSNKIFMWFTHHIFSIFVKENPTITSLFWHFWNITFQILKLLCLAKDHLWGFSTRNTRMVHIVH